MTTYKLWDTYPDWEWRTEYDSEWKVIPPPLDWKWREVIEWEKIVDVPNYTQYTDYKGESGSILSRENTQSQIEILTQALQQLQQQVFNQ